MKKLHVLFAACIISGNSFAQIALDVKTADLSANGKSYKARFVSATKAAGEIKMTFYPKLRNE